MSWQSKIGRIVVLNLPSRTDRLLEFTEQAEKYNIPFDRISAINDADQGARGLRDTMVKLFTEEIEKETHSVLVFEDDALAVTDEWTFSETMEKVIAQLPENYIMCLLGCQPTSGFSHFVSPNLLPAIKCFSTHAVLYSLQGMKDILASQLNFPIDNHYVDHVQTIGRCYCTYPLLMSQREGFSDIGRQVFSWRPFIESRYEQKVNELRSK